MLLAVPLVGPCHSVHNFDALREANDRASAHAYLSIFICLLISHFLTAFRSLYNNNIQLWYYDISTADETRKLRDTIRKSAHTR